MIIRKISFLFCFFLTLTAYSQTPLEFTYASGGNIVPGQPLDIEVHVNDFDALQGIQVAFAWDSLIMEIDTIPFHTDDVADFNSGVFSLPNQTFNMTKGILRVSWFSFAGVQTVEDDHHLFTMRFNVIGDPCDTTSVRMTSPPAPLMIEITDENGANVGAISQDLPVMIPGTDCGVPPPPSDDIGLNFTDETVTAGATNVCFPFTVTNFDSIEAFQGGIMWDPAVLSFTQNQSFGLPGMSASSFGTNNTDQGIMTFLWFDLSGANPVSLADNTTVFEVCFDVVGAQGSTTKLKAYDHPVSFIQVAQPAPNGTQPFTVGEACISVGTPPPPGVFTLNIPEVSTGPNAETVCIDVTTENFTDITGMQFTMTWDPTLLCYQGVSNLNQTIGIFEPLFNLAGDDNEKLRFSWNNPEVTVPDGTLAYTVCFDVKEDNCGETATVSFIDDLVPIEITSGTMAIDFSLNSGNVNIVCGTGPMISSETVINPRCSGDSNGSVSITIEGGTGPYTCKWSTGEVDNTASTCLIVGQPAGPLSVVVCDAMGETVERMFNLIAPSPINITGTTTATTCTSNGSINFNITGGTQPYQQQWTNNIDPNSVAAGTWTLLVTDANMCQATMPFTVANGCNNCPELDVLIFSTSCGCTGRIQVSCSQGSLTSAPVSSPPLTWDPAQSAFINACEETYIITTTDGNGTTAQATVNQIAPAALNPQVLNIVPAGCSGSGGTFDVNVTGGCPGYQITVGLLPNGAKVPYDPSSSYIPGDYQVCVVDSEGNTAERNFNIPINSTGQISIDVTDITNATCMESGSATINVSGGCNPTCRLTLPDGSTMPIVSGQQLDLDSGTYMVDCQDNLNQTAQTTFIIDLEGSEPLGLQLIENDAICNGMSGSVELVVSGGCGVVTCTYDPGTGVFVSCPPSNIITVLPGITVVVTVADEGGNIITQNATVGISDDAFSLAIDEIGCNFILVSPVGGQGPFTYTWVLPDGSTSNDSDLTDLTMDGSYSLSAEDANGCSAGLNIPNFVENCVGTDPMLSISAVSDFNGLNAPCAPENGPCEAVLEGVISGVAPFVLSLTDVAGITSTYNIDDTGLFSITDICAGSYVVSSDDAVGNTINLADPLLVTGPASALVIEEDNIDCEDEGEQNGSIDAFVTGGVGNYNYSWNPTGGEGNQFENAAAGGYFLTVTDDNGCTAVAQFTVLPCTGPEPCFESSTVITPNGDGQNEFFIITCAEDSDNSLLMFDRWGNTVLDVINYQNNWNGLDLDNQEVPEGAYYWVLRTENNRIEKGTVTILRN